MSPLRSLCIALSLAVGLGVLSPSPVSAFHAAQSYTRPISAPNGTGGVFYTGSPRARGLTCGACHLDAAGDIDLEITSEPADFGLGRYQPETFYRITVSLIGEHLGLQSAANENAFLADVVDGAGQAVGLFEQTESTVAPPEAGVIIGRPAGGATTWTFFYRTPAAGSGPVVFFASAVDGNGRDELVKAVVDPFGDDVGERRLVVCEGTATCSDPLAVVEEPATSAVACSVGAGSSPLSLILILLALALIQKERR